VKEGRSRRVGSRRLESFIFFNESPNERLPSNQSLVTVISVTVKLVTVKLVTVKP
jgi:hypothetical protein